MLPIKMVDLHSQYLQIKPEIDQAISNVIADSAFIGGKYVADFSDSLKKYLNADEVITCGNGTDALQLALMALNLQPGDEVIVPDFSFVAPAEATALLNLVPVFADVDPHSYNLTAETIAAQITEKTKAVIVVHLFGQMADMKPIMELAKQHNLKIIEDVAQSFGAKCEINGEALFAGTIGDVGCTSFFPSKNLACFGDGGAIFTKNSALASKMRMIANHGQAKKYTHNLIGINSRLDGLQAAILSVKLQRLETYISARREVANCYTKQLATVEWLTLPQNIAKGLTHTYNQYTVQLKNGIDRVPFIQYLKERQIPVMVYYESSISSQVAYKPFSKGTLKNIPELCNNVVSLPIHTECSQEQLMYICNSIKSFNG